MAFKPHISHEDQFNMLMLCRHAVLEKGESVFSFAKKVGIPHTTLCGWSKNHCVSVYNTNPYTTRMMKWLLIYRYGPFVRNSELCPAVGYTTKNIHVVRWHFNAALLSVSPWSGRMPRIIFRDILEISKMVAEYESVYLVAKEAGYTVSDIRHVFDLDTQRIVRDKIKEISEKEVVRKEEYRKKRSINRSK